MNCCACSGTGWKIRQKPHPMVPGKLVNVTSVCRFCAGKGTVKEFVPSGKDWEETDE